ncbi:MAG: hypothetical protein ABI616_03200 [Pseudomonadota bacterium]
MALTVTHHLQAQVFLELYDLGAGLILNGAQSSGIQGVGLDLCAGVEQVHLVDFAWRCV